MARARKRHVQQELLLPEEGRTRKNRRGTSRRRPGRPKKPGAGERHEQRERFDKLRVIHVTLSVGRQFDTLRKRDTYFAIRKATLAVLGRHDFRIVHMSPEDDHIHLIIEADNHNALWRGMQAFQISAAQHLNQALSKRTRTLCRGKVFVDRYHPVTVTSPTQARNTLNYVLNNWRRHHHDYRNEAQRGWDVDYMSSAISFAGWKELERPGARFQYNIELNQRLCVSPPQSWLLNVGWRRGGSISMYSIPHFDPHA
jgi:REP element-mobilizing transposase RayT